MDIRPPRTTLPSQPIRRRHTPKPSNRYHDYRACLRWDFGFTCAFCLLHERDFTQGAPAKRSGTMTIEHVVPQSVNPSATSSYDNVLLACKYCNRSRSAALSRPEYRLLDPSMDAWADHFEFVGSELRFLPGDNDAEYTWKTYDLDDPLKVGQRTWRDEHVQELCDVLTTAPARIAALEALAEEPGRSPAEREELIDVAADIRRRFHAARIDLPFFAAIPADHDEKCRCETSEHRSLPTYLADQIVSVPLS